MLLHFVINFNVFRISIHTVSFINIHIFLYFPIAFSLYLLYTSHWQNDFYLKSPAKIPLKIPCKGKTDNTYIMEDDIK